MFFPPNSQVCFIDEFVAFNGMEGKMFEKDTCNVKNRMGLCFIFLTCTNRRWFSVNLTCVGFFKNLKINNFALNVKDHQLCSYHLKTAWWFFFLGGGIQQNLHWHWCPGIFLAGFLVCYKLSSNGYMKGMYLLFSFHNKTHFEQN